MKAINQMLKLTSLFFLLFGCSLSNGMNHKIFKPGPVSDSFTIDAIEWPTYEEKNSNNPFLINVYVANLFFGLSKNNEVTYLGSETCEYGKISLRNQYGLLKDFDIDLEEFKKKDNGIIRDYANFARLKDFKLKYSFNLQEIFKESFNGTISIIIDFQSKRVTGHYHRGEEINFDFTKNLELTKITFIDYESIHETY